jgi:predicted esterase
MAYHASEESRSECVISGPALADSDWPSRDKACLEPVRAATPEKYYRLQLDGSKTVDQLSPIHARLVTDPCMVVTFNQIVGQGLLRVVTDPNQPDPDDLRSWSDVRQGFHANAWFLSSLSYNDPRRGTMLAAMRRLRAKDENGSPSAGVRYSNVDLSTAIKEGIPICLPPVQATQPRGLLIHFVAIMGNGYEAAVMKTLRDDGWAVIDVDSNPRLSGGGHTYNLGTDQEIDDAATSLARRIDDVLAEHAYAAEAALEFCRQHRPDLPSDKVSIIGFSAGALVVPTVAARLGNDVQSAVLIAGGANLLEVAMDSALSDGGIHIKWQEGRGGPTDRQRLLSGYLQHSKLDPFRTASTLAHKPVLQYWGQWDTWVPAKTGALLYEQLNHPDKVTFLGGHALLFYFLPGQSGRICRWMDHAMESQLRLSHRGTAPDTTPEPRRDTATR